MPKQICLYALLILFIASLTLQFIRVRLRKKIVQGSEKYIPGTGIEYEWSKADEGLRAIFADMKRMNLLKNSTGHLPGHIHTSLRNFRILNAVELTTTLSLILLAAFGYKICI